MPDSSPNNYSEPLPKPTFEIETYVQQALQLLALSLPPEQLPSVVENFDRIRTIAQPVLDFPNP